MLLFAGKEGITLATRVPERRTTASDSTCRVRVGTPKADNAITIHGEPQIAKDLEAGGVKRECEDSVKLRGRATHGEGVRS